MKNTKQKQMIMDAVKTLQNHPTADEIYTVLRKNNEHLSLGTVYRNLGGFSETGVIKKIPVPGFGDRFDFRTDEHEHMLCEKCGRVFDIEGRVDIANLFPSDNFKVTGYKLLLYGVCDSCINDEAL